MAAMRVLITRPRLDAERWVMALGARGLQAQALPLIEIAPTSNPLAVMAARENLKNYAMAMFVSANAVNHFFGSLTSKSPEGPELTAQSAIKTRVWATGPGTLEALLRAGFRREQIDAPADDALQFDSEALWVQVANQVRPGCRALIVRGSDARGQIAGRGWLARQMQAAGAVIDEVVAYQRNLPHWTAEMQALARLAAGDGTVWLFSSSEALEHLRALVPGQSWQSARAITTHPRIAQTARADGFGVVLESRPTVPDVAASIESIA